MWWKDWKLATLQKSWINQVLIYFINWLEVKWNITFIASYVFLLSIWIIEHYFIPSQCLWYLWNTTFILDRNELAFWLPLLSLGPHSWEMQDTKHTPHFKNYVFSLFIIILIWFIIIYYSHSGETMSSTWAQNYEKNVSWRVNINLFSRLFFF